MPDGRSPTLPIVDQPSAYDVVEFHLHALEGEPCLDLTLVHRDSRARRRLRFFSPREGKYWFGPAPTPCPFFYDVSARGIEGRNVLVADEEEVAAGPLSFWARAVAEVGESA
jgi:hypothetical protein